MKALFVDGPAAGQVIEYPLDTTTIDMRSKPRPLDPMEIMAGDGQLPPDGQMTFTVIHYVKFATDHAGRSLFKVERRN